MKKIAYKFLSLALAVSFFAFASVGASQAQALAQAVGPCLDNRSVSAAVASGQILPLAQISRRAGLNPAEILNTRVCQINGQAYYFVDTLGAYGATKNLVLRATDAAPYIGG